VAYKAETNIVDLIPMANQLKLAINMRYADINDPRGMCIDISNISHWGNGQIEVILKNIDDLPYIIGLVQQSLDAQLGGQE
jgi:predicted transport protein